MYSCTAGSGPRITSQIFLIISFIIKPALLQAKVNAVKRDQLWEEDLFSLVESVREGVAEDEATSFGAVGVEVGVNS